MRKPISLVATVGLASLILVGCAAPNMTGPERKFGRGMNNLTEFVRGGEIRRSQEQTALFHNTDTAYTTGFIHGFNRSLGRTAAGVWEIATFPFPNGPGNDYGPIFMPENPVYPASYKPSLIADQMFSTDKNMGFSGGDAFPMIPGSKFRVFETH